MTNLDKLYNSIENLKELGLPLNKETLEAVNTLEEDLIKNEIIPRLAENIEPIITKIKRPIVLVVDYIPNEDLSVRLTRNKVITDEVETKQYPLSIKEHSGRKTDRKILSSPKSRKTGLSVIYPDGTKIERKYAYETFLEVIEKAGVEKVEKLEMRWVGLPLVSKVKDDFYNQHEISGGWLIVTHSATNQKRTQLEEISKKLDLGLRIDVI